MPYLFFKDHSRFILVAMTVIVMIIRKNVAHDEIAICNHVHLHFTINDQLTIYNYHH